MAGDLRGRVAILDFWTYCCINCMHVLPVLRRIEERFAAEPVVVIGVHSAKFISEKDPQNIRRAVERHGVVHPVVVDSDHDVIPGRTGRSCASPGSCTSPGIACSSPTPATTGS